MADNDVFALIVVVLCVFVVGMIYAISREGDSQRAHDKAQREADRQASKEVQASANKVTELQFATMINAMKESLGLMQVGVNEIAQATKEGFSTQTSSITQLLERQKEQLVLQTKDEEISMETKDLIQAMARDLVELETKVTKLEVMLTERLSEQDRNIMEGFKSLIEKLEALMKKDEG